MIICNEDQVKLITAIENNESEVVSEVLARNKDNTVVQPVGSLCVTALQLASWQGKLDLLEELWKRGADVNVQDKIGRCSLYYAAHRGHVDVVKWLLQHGSSTENRVGVTSCSKDFSALPLTPTFFVGRNLPVPECWGRTPLHQAVKNNHLDVVEILVKVGANVNAEDERGITPLLLAGSRVDRENSVEMSKFTEIIHTLVSAKASVNVIHPDTGTTALHHTAALGSAAGTRILLNEGAYPLSQCKSTGSTPLHIAANLGSVETILALLEVMEHDDIDIPDKISRTALHRSAYQGHRECVRLLINHGSNLAAETETGVTVVDAIIANIPRPLFFLEDLLDSRVRFTGNSREKESSITVDFSLLTPKGQLQMGVVTAVIAAALDVEQLSILQHPLLETFLRLKWAKLRVFFFLLVFVHILFILSLSSYSIILLRYGTDCTLPRRILAFCSCILLSHNGAQVLMLPRHYVRQYETWLSLITSVISLVISVAGDYVPEIVIRSREEILNGSEQPSQWVLHSISVAILLGWMQMMLLVGRFPTWGYYALMFSTVLRNILKVLLAFVCLIVGFALSFAVLFHGNDQFRDSWRAVVKTVVMMMGEYEYGDLFPDERNESPFLPGTSRLVFLSFVMLASIVLMNLMIGLAVNDIQGLEKEGHIRRLLKQAEFVAHLERVTSHRIFRSNWLHPRLRMLLDSRRSIPTKITFGYHEHYFHDSSRDLSPALVESLFQLASNNSHGVESLIMRGKQKNNSTDLTSLLFNLEQQLQQLRVSYYPVPLGWELSKSQIKRNQVLRRKSTNV